MSSEAYHAATASATGQMCSQLVLAQGGGWSPAYARVVGHEHRADSSSRLPGADIVEKGIADLVGGIESAESLPWRPSERRDLAGRDRGAIVDPLAEQRLYELFRFPAVDPGAFRRCVEGAFRAA